MSGNGPSVWPWRRGDGDVALAVAYARTPADEDEAKRASHDFVVRQTGERRAGPIHWLIWPRDEGVRKLREIDIHLTPGEREYLAASPDALVVVAVAATDAARPTPVPPSSTGRPR